MKYTALAVVRQYHSIIRMTDDGNFGNGELFAHAEGS